jgi:hypothetical protein
VAGDRSKAGNADRIRINVEDEDELRAWALKFSVSEQRLREAVEKVGPVAQQVAQELDQPV